MLISYNLLLIYIYIHTHPLTVVITRINMYFETEIDLSTQHCYNGNIICFNMDPSYLHIRKHAIKKQKYVHGQVIKERTI